MYSTTATANGLAIPMLGVLSVVCAVVWLLVH